MAHKLHPESLVTIKTRSGFDYSTHVQRPKNGKPWVLLIHGFPSSAYDWRHQVTFLSQEGYGLIVPDTLGYGRTSKPLDAEHYALKSVSDSIMDVVDHVAGAETKVHGVGHDWGAALLSRAANFHTERFMSYAFLAGGYSTPVSFDIDAIIRSSKEALGYSTLGYFKLFNSDEGGSIVDGNQTSFVDLLYPNDWELWKQYMGPVGGLKGWLEGNKRSDPPSYLTSDEIATHREIFAPAAGGYTPALGYYKAAVRGFNDSSNAAVAPPGDHTSRPTIFIGGDADPLAPFSVQCKVTQAFAKDARFEAVPGAGHWPHIENPAQVNNALKAHFERAE